jgi:hypothetical protein
MKNKISKWLDAFEKYTRKVAYILNLNNIYTHAEKAEKTLIDFNKLKAKQNDDAYSFDLNACQRNLMSIMAICADLKREIKNEGKN